MLTAGLLQGTEIKNFHPVKSITVEQDGSAIVLRPPEGVHFKKAFLEISSLDLSTDMYIGISNLPLTTLVDELGDPIYQGVLRIPIEGKNLGSQTKIKIVYQPCTEGPGGVCYPPTTQELIIDGMQVNQETITAISLWLLGVAFLAGLVASFTPCVYPMIPLTMAILGTKQQTRQRSFARASVLVLGMAVTYTVLGILAAMSGSVFGAMTQSPWFIVPASAVIAAFGFSLLGFFKITLPSEIQSALQNISQRSPFWAPLLTGMVLGPLSAPCIGPVIGTILVDISQQGNIFAGGLRLFFFALGMGVPFIVAGTFGSLLPKSGAWLMVLERLLGFSVLGFALWNMKSLLPLWGLLAFCFGLAFTAFRTMALGKFRWAALAFVVYYGIRLIEVGANYPIIKGTLAYRLGIDTTWKSNWIEQDYESALIKAQQTQKIVLVDIYAEWCAGCYELDEKTWPHPEVRQWIERYAIPVRINTDKERKDLAQPMQIQGYPTVIIYDDKGVERGRILGFQTPKDMLKFLNAMIATPIVP